MPLIISLDALFFLDALLALTLTLTCTVFCLNCASVLCDKNQAEGFLISCVEQNLQN